MPADEAPPLTVAELLPALVELASIQTDLLRALERPQASYFARMGLKSGFSPVGQSEPVGIDTTSLQARAQRLLRWLLEKSDALPRQVDETHE